MNQCEKKRTRFYIWSAIRDLILALVLFKSVKNKFLASIKRPNRDRTSCGIRSFCSLCQYLFRHQWMSIVVCCCYCFISVRVSVMCSEHSHFLSPIALFTVSTLISQFVFNFVWLNKNLKQQFWTQRNNRILWGWEGKKQNDNMEHERQAQNKQSKLKVIAAKENVGTKLKVFQKPFE